MIMVGELLVDFTTAAADTADGGGTVAIVVAIIAVASAIGTPIVTNIMGRRRDSRTDGRLDYSEIQEDVGELRRELRASKAEMGAEIEWLRSCLRIVDQEVIELRADVSLGRVPPLQPRPVWPPRPVVNAGGA